MKENPVEELIGSGRIKLNIFDDRASSVYLDGKFIGWLRYAPRQTVKFIFGVHADYWTGETREEAIGNWLAETTKSPPGEPDGR